MGDEKTRRRLTVRAAAPLRAGVAKPGRRTGPRRRRAHAHEGSTPSARIHLDDQKEAAPIATNKHMDHELSFRADERAA